MLGLLLRGCVLGVVSGCVSMGEVRKNMPRWVGAVPYSHLVNKTWGTPTDCSGFVSWVLGAGRDLKAYEYASDSFSSRITTDDLRYGDIVTHVFDGSDVVKRCGGATSNNKALGHPSGHVFFFDRWNDTEHTAFWAFESTETEDQTTACKAQHGLLTRSHCLNHHVVKRRKSIDKWANESCTDSTYGRVSGGARRLSADLLCLNNTDVAAMRVHA